jgi:mRNA-degrading endonuclease toxin of MazEF toxin-antitoxin module
MIELTTEQAQAIDAQGDDIVVIDPRGDVLIAVFPNADGSPAKLRPVLVVQADVYSTKIKNLLVAAPVASGEIP